MTALVHRPALRGGAGSGGLPRVSPAAVHAMGCVLAFSAVLAGGIHLANAADWSGLAHSRALLAAAQTRAADAQRVLLLRDDDATDIVRRRATIIRRMRRNGRH